MSALRALSARFERIKNIPSQVYYHKPEVEYFFFYLIGKFSLRGEKFAFGNLRSVGFSRRFFTVEVIQSF